MLFAPTLRYSDGTFFVACTNTAPRDPALGRAGGNVGNFVVHADDPSGNWSDAAWVDTAAFDPSLTFDNGRCFYTRRSFDLGNPSAGLGPIVQAEIDPFTGTLAADLVPITCGPVGFCSNDIEGPHLYRIGQYYYLFSAEGGTEKGHMQTCARSHSPWGPFEPAPHNPVLSHRHLMAHPIQCTGHAELIDAPDGSWWALFLATRTDRLQGPNILGRETFLAPVRWRGGWPVIGNAGTVELQMPAPRLPRATESRRPGASPWLDGWSTRQQPLPGVCIDRDAGRVELPVTPATLDDAGPVGAAFLRQLEHRASFSATVPARPAGSVAGITAYVAPEHHYDLTVDAQPGGRRVVLRRRAADLVGEQVVMVPGEGPIRLTVDCDGADYRFTARADGPDMVIGSGSARLLDADLAPGFGSVRLGVYATGSSGGTVTMFDVGGEAIG